MLKKFRLLKLIKRIIKSLEKNPTAKGSPTNLTELEKKHNLPNPPKEKPNPRESCLPSSRSIILPQPKNNSDLYKA